MKKKVTIKDVAQEAGVSVATVSYVVNNRTDMRISDQTRKKVLQIINLLGYTPNQSAQALATNRNRMVALYLSPNASALKRAEQMYFLDFFSSFLHEKNYGLVYLSSHFTEKYDAADVIVAYDVSKDYFQKIGDNNFVPLLALDCFIDNFLFYQVNSDYKKIARTAEAYFNGRDYTLLTLDTDNQEKKLLLESSFPSVSFVSELACISNSKANNILVIDYSIYELAKQQKQADSLCYVPLISAQKCASLFQCIEYALERTSDKSHDVLL